MLAIIVRLDINNKIKIRGTMVSCFLHKAFNFIGDQKENVKPNSNAPEMQMDGCAETE